MVARLATYATQLQANGPGPHWADWDGGGPGWWLVFPILFWTVALSVLGYLLYRFSGGQSARRHAERALAERYARGEIGEDELRQRRSVLRGRS